MNKNIWLGILLAAVIGLGAYLLLGKEHLVPQVAAPAATAFDPSNATYTIDGQPVILLNGKAEAEVAPGSAAKIVTSVFGVPVLGDISNDGQPDAVVVLVQDTGGSGTFYYVAAAIDNGNGAEGTNAVLLGDRIAPKNIQIAKEQIIANYADRNPGEAMVVPPSVGVTKYFEYDGSMLVAFVQ